MLPNSRKTVRKGRSELFAPEIKWFRMLKSGVPSKYDCIQNSILLLTQGGMGLVPDCFSFYEKSYTTQDSFWRGALPLI